MAFRTLTTTSIPRGTGAAGTNEDSSPDRREGWSDHFPWAH
jgi:hypothetical protein